MIIQTKDIQTIIRYIYNEGCILVEDNNVDVHPELEICNRAVKSITQSFVDKGYLKRVFVWKHAYCTLTEAGITALQEKLCIQDSRMPATHSSEIIRDGYGTMDGEEKRIEGETGDENEVYGGDVNDQGVIVE